MQLDSSRWSVHNNLGLAHLYRREVRAAVEQFEASLRYAATPAAYTNLGFSYEQLGDRDKAAYYYRRALLLNPRFQKAREGLAEVEGQRT
jgi:Tfp pilus assembly protein PilF